MKTYEELSGAQGRQIFYRAERYKVRDLFRKTLPDLTLDEAPYNLQDLSLNGMGATAQSLQNDVYNPGMQVAVQLGLRGVPLFEGKGEITRTEQTQTGTKVGIRLRDCIDISQIVTKYQEILIRADIDSFASENINLGVSPEYRMMASDVLHLLRTFRANLDQFDQQKLSAENEAEILATCEERILPSWREHWHRANALVEPIMDQALELRATKRFTELVLTPEFMAGAIWNRSYAKPLGYPGDFKIMSMVYDWRREGKTLYEKLSHRLGLEVAECIATRMTDMRVAIAQSVLTAPAATAENRPARIASLGCGPAREVVDYLGVASLPRRVDFSLIDQDHEALTSAYERTYPAVVRHGGKATVSCLNASFVQLLRGELFEKLPPQDLIYTVGLIDYLVPKRVKSLVNTLYANLAPGGRLIVGNMHRCAGSNLWPMEFLTDWNILYRDAHDMAAFASGLPGVSFETFYDSTQRVVMVSMVKKG
ncbi:MAG TPA: class I SAM-dependent methyltransferase [Alphaproteobacteria bacterium]|nr:class I SAM-dependent methyltransferase [Alphaproteobacteria bacterium]